MKLPRPHAAVLAVLALAYVAIVAWLYGLGINVRAKPVAKGQTAPIELAWPRIFPRRGIRCGSARWPVKTMIDANADDVNLVPIRTTVTNLAELPRPLKEAFTAETDNHRLHPIELATYTVRALAVTMKTHGDRDVSIVMVDPGNLAGHMIAKLVDARCAGAINSRARDRFTRARNELRAIFGASDSPAISLDGRRFALTDFFDFGTPRAKIPPAQLTDYATVEITGVGFWSTDSPRAGAAPNGLELHPVLDIRRTK